MDYYQKKIEVILEELTVDPEIGLSQSEAETRLQTEGPNEIPKPTTWIDDLKTVIAPLLNWLIVIYLIGALILFVASKLQGETNLSMIYTTLGIVAVNCFVAIVQQARATKKLNALRELSAPISTVIRDGEKQDIPSRNLVKGDILVLKLGDRIPADARILNSSNLEVNEASLTGESDPVKKNKGDALTGTDISIAERINTVFFGTYITTGNGKAVVVKTGGETEIGRISKGLEEAGTSEIPIQKKMNNFGKYLGLLVMGFWLVVLLVVWASTGQVDVVKSLNSAMDIMPINIPLLSTVVMLTGVLAMAKTGVIIRNLASVDSLGRVSVVCSDKTGTLTKSQMTVKNIWTFDGLYYLSGNGYDPSGALYDSPLSDTDPNAANNPEPIAITKREDLPLSVFNLILSGQLNNNAEIRKEKVSREEGTIETWIAVGNPTEAALVSMYHKTINPLVKQLYEEWREYPFSSKLKRMSKIRHTGKTTKIYSKGASSVILELCSSYLSETGIQPLNDEKIAEINKQVEFFASQGYRVLSLCERELEISKQADLPEDRAEIEKDLVYLGFVTILDPPREGVKQAVIDCHNAGVEVIMITGDAPATARSIAEQIQIITSPEQEAILGAAIDTRLDDPTFDNIKVFARVSPENKQTIVKKYQAEKKVVAMTGDGVNDALALNMADAGLAMGIQGTDVAKEAADMVISDDSFNSIVKGIEQGRGIFTKIRMVVFFYICINLFEGVVQFFLAVILNLPYFLNAEFNYQWIWLSITVHMFPGFILTFDTTSKDVMKEKPRDSEEILSKNIIAMMGVYGILLAIAMVGIYFMVMNGAYGVSRANYIFTDPSEFLYTIENLFNPELYNEENLAVIQALDITTLRTQGKALTMLMAMLFFSECFLALQIRRPNKSLWRSIKEDSNRFMYEVVGLLFLAFLSLMYIPNGQIWFAKHGMNFMFMYLTFGDWVICFLFALITIFGLELFKKLARDRKIMF